MYLVVLDNSTQFQRQQEQQLGQEETDDKVTVDGVGIGLLLPTDQTQADERHGQEEHASHQTDVSNHIFGHGGFRQRLEKMQIKIRPSLKQRKRVNNSFSKTDHTMNSSLFITTAMGPKLEQVQLTWKSS